MKFFPWLDFFIFGGLALFALICGFLVTLSGPHTTLELCLTWGIGFVFVVIATAIVVRKAMAGPDFVTAQGTAVWTNGIKEITVGDMAAALDFYAVSLPKFTGLVTQKDIEDMFEGACVSWQKGSITLMGIGWIVKDKCGLQQGKRIIVQYPNDKEIAHSAFYHELHHMTDEIILKRDPDYQHLRKDWWYLLTRMGVSA